MGEKEGERRLRWTEHDSKGGVQEREREERKERREGECLCARQRESWGEENSGVFHAGDS